jgi:hypothetical protein
MTEFKRRRSPLCAGCRSAAPHDETGYCEICEIAIAEGLNWRVLYDREARVGAISDEPD